MAAEVNAASREMPLPPSTASVPEAGRIATATGTPRVSRSVMSATRVMPAFGR
jgi:hypothetical protein